jgi:hypothetical protein
MGKIFQGTELKMSLRIEPFGQITMKDYMFRVELISGTLKKQSIIIEKDKMIPEDDVYLICFSTAELGIGRLKCRVTAEIPDAHFEDGFRTEISEIDTGIDIIKTI